LDEEGRLPLQLRFVPNAINNFSDENAVTKDLYVRVERITH
jgi:hypothetical protein